MYIILIYCYQYIRFKYSCWSIFIQMGFSHTSHLPTTYYKCGVLGSIKASKR